MTAIRALSAVRRASRNEGKYEPLRSFGMSRETGPTPRAPFPRAIAVSLIDAIGRALAERGARLRLDLEIHHAARDEADHFPEEIVVGALLDQRLQCQSVEGHGLVPVACVSQTRANRDSDHDRLSRGCG
jgi:hypothetical protein